MYHECTHPDIHIYTQTMVITRHKSSEAASLWVRRRRQVGSPVGNIRQVWEREQGWNLKSPTKVCLPDAASTIIKFGFYNNVVPESVSWERRPSQGRNVTMMTPIPPPPSSSHLSTSSSHPQHLSSRPPSHLQSDTSSPVVLNPGLPPPNFGWGEFVVGLSVCKFMHEPNTTREWRGKSRPRDTPVIRGSVSWCGWLGGCVGSG